MRVPAHLPRRTRGSVAALLAVLALTAGCASGPGATSAASEGHARTVASGNVLDQKVPTVAATTRLEDQSGRVRTLRGLRGRTVVLAPLLTMCQETCPMTTENLHRAAQAVAGDRGAGRVVFLEVTVDPQRDTVRRLHAYAKLYGAQAGWSSPPATRHR